MTYLEAQKLFQTAKSDARGKPLASNTRLYDRGTHYAVRYHETDVVEIYPNGRYVLNTGGWYSKTTKDRLNWYSPVQIYQKKFVWYVAPDHTEFKDGMEVWGPNPYNVGRLEFA